MSTRGDKKLRKELRKKAGTALYNEAVEFNKKAQREFKKKTIMTKALVLMAFFNMALIVINIILLIK